MTRSGSSMSAKKFNCRNNAKASVFNRDSYTTPERSKSRNVWRAQQCETINTPLHSNGLVSKELCDNLEEILPLMETFMGNNEKSPFTHRASPVYTPAPTREKYAKKAMVTPASLKSSRHRKRFYQSQNKDESSIVMDKLNLLKRFEGEDALSSTPSCSPAFENELEIIQNMPDLASVKSDGQEEKCSENDRLLQSMEQFSVCAKRDGGCCTEIIRLQNKVEELEKLLAEKAQDSFSAQLEVEKKQSKLVFATSVEQCSENEIADMKSHLKEVEGGGLKSDENTRIYDLNELKCQVVALRYQLEAADSKSVQKLMEVAGLSKCCLSKDVKDDGEETMLYCNKDEECPIDEEYKPEQTGIDKRNMELAKRQYFAALVAAKEEPGEESLALAAALRMQLESFLAIPSFATFVSYPFRRHALSN